MENKMNSDQNSFDRANSYMEAFSQLECFEDHLPFVSMKNSDEVESRLKVVQKTEPILLMISDRTQYTSSSDKIKQLFPNKNLFGT